MITPLIVVALRRKMERYQANGAQLGWLLIPEEQAVEVWLASGTPLRIEAVAGVKARGVCETLYTLLNHDKNRPDHRHHRPRRVVFGRTAAGEGL